jgi:hypothetical protein
MVGPNNSPNCSVSVRAVPVEYERLIGSNKPGRGYGPVIIRQYKGWERASSEETRIFLSQNVHQFCNVTP